MENVVEEKGIKYWVRESRHLLLFILWLFISDYRLSFFKMFLPENILVYQISIGFIVYLNVIVLVIMLDIPFFEQTSINLKTLKTFVLFNLVLIIFVLFVWVLEAGLVAVGFVFPDAILNLFGIIFIVGGSLCLIAGGFHLVQKLIEKP